MERQPKTKKGQRALQKKAPKWEENTKTVMFVRGPKTSEIVHTVLKELYILKKPNAINFTKRENNTRPFEDESSIEFLAQKNDSSLFCYGSHSKKRMDNLVFGRLYDYHILDMFEFGVEDFKSIYDFESEKYSNIQGGQKSCIIFQGTEWEENNEFQHLKSFFLDFFRGIDLNEIDLSSIDTVIYIVIVNQKILFRRYRIVLKKSGTKIPKTVLEEIGPHLDLTIRRTQISSEDLWKESLKQSPSTRLGKLKKEKNKNRDLFMNKIGRIHLKQQHLSTLQTKHSKALRVRKRSSIQSNDSNDGEESDNRSTNSITSTTSTSTNSNSSTPRNKKQKFIENDE